MAAPVTAAPRVTKTQTRAAVVLVAVCVASAAFVYSFFMDRSPEFDELVLGNPIHMYLHSPRLTYPAHGQWDYMVVHPPTHYVVVGTVMRITGLNLFQAAGVPIFVLFVCTVALIVTGEFAFNVKIGLMFGLYAAVFVWGHFRPVRPDLHVAVAWFCGLVALEAARLSGWSMPRLAAGTLLVTYASALHYPASFAFLSALVFAGWCLRDLGWKATRSRLLVMAIAAVVVGAPYFWQFVWPLWREILAFVRLVGETTFKSPWKLHLQTYAIWWSHPEMAGAFYQWQHRPITTLVTAPLFALRIPASIVGPLLLARFKTARGIALAAVPHLAFLLFLVGGQGKNETNTGYYVAEMSIYLAGIVAWAVFLLAKFVASLTRRQDTAWTSVVPAVLVSAALFVDVPNSMTHRFALTPRLAYEELLRGLGHEMLGPGAAVGTSSPTMWWHSGAELYYLLMPDLLYPDDVSRVDVRRFFTRFDAIGIGADSSGVTWNRQRKSVTEWYADGLLKLRNFVLAGGTLSYLLLGPEHKAPVVGFVYDHEGKRLWRFTEVQPANAVLVVVHGPAAGIASEQVLNDSTWAYQSFRMASDQRGLQGNDVLQAVLLPVSRLDRAEAALAKYSVVERIAGRIAPEDLTSRLERGANATWPLEIPRTLAEVEARRARPSGPALVPACDSLLPEATIKNNGIVVSAPRLTWELVCRSKALQLVPGSDYRVSFKLGISRGGAAVSIMSSDLKEYRAQLGRKYPQQLWPEAIVFTASESTAFLTVGAFSERAGPSVFEVRDLMIAPVALR